MMNNDDGTLLPVSAVATRLFGDRSDASRKRVRYLVDQGKLRGTRLSELRGSPYWVTRKSFEQYVTEIEGE